MVSLQYKLYINHANSLKAPTRAGENNAKKRIGRPPGSRNSGVPTDRVAKSVASAKRGETNKSRKKSRKGEEEDELSALVSTHTQPSQARKRKTQPEADEIAEQPTRVQKKYVQLEPKTKRIPQNIVETWPHLSQQVLDQISAVVKDAKKDIANTQRDERKVMAAHNTLNPLVKRLVRHLAASKIPPQAKDIHFNIDKLTDRNGHVFRDVTTARHSKQLLSEQVKATQTLLTKDEKSLDELKKNAKRWKAEWKHQQRHGRVGIGNWRYSEAANLPQVHPLLRDSEGADTNGDYHDDIRLKSVAAIDARALDASDAELASILEQLRRSLENMQGNHAQVEGIGEAMTEAQTALDDVLFRHVSAQQYAAL